VNTTIKINRRAAGYYEFETTNGTHTIARLVVTRGMAGWEHRRPGTYWVHTAGGEFSPSSEFRTLRDAVAYAREHYCAPHAGLDYTVVEDEHNFEVFTVQMSGNVIGSIYPDERTIDPSGLWAALVTAHGEEPARLVGYFADPDGAARRIREQHNASQAPTAPISAALAENTRAANAAPAGVDFGDTTGPDGQTEPVHRDSRVSFRALTPERRDAVRSAAGAYHRAGTHTPGKAWTQAVIDDWRTWHTLGATPDAP